MESRRQLRVWSNNVGEKTVVTGNGGETVETERRVMFGILLVA